MAGLQTYATNCKINPVRVSVWLAPVLLDRSGCPQQIECVKSLKSSCGDCLSTSRILFRLSPVFPVSTHCFSSHIPRSPSNTVFFFFFSFFGTLALLCTRPLCSNDWCRCVCWIHPLDLGNVGWAVLKHCCLPTAPWCESISLAPVAMVGITHPLFHTGGKQVNDH